MTREHDIVAPVTSMKSDVPPRRRGRMLHLLIVVMVFGILFHVPLLKGLAELLVDAEGLQEGDQILVLSGDRCFETAAGWAREKPTVKVLRISAVPNRLERFEILPTDQELFLSEMQKHGVPESQLEIIPNPRNLDWEAPESAAEWLQQHPNETVAALSHAFHTRRLRLQLQRALPDEANRIHLVPLFHRDVNVDNWWKSREGIRQVTFAWMELIATWWGNDFEFPTEQTWDPDQYEEELRNPNRENAAPVRSEGWLPAIARWLDIGEPIQKVDYLVLLPGDEKTRPFAAAAIFNAGLASEIVFPSTPLRPEQSDGILPETAEIISRVLSKRGVPEERIHRLPGQSDKTIDDGRITVPFLKEHPEGRVAILTNNYHTRRARLVFESLYPEGKDRFLFVSVPTEYSDADNWWKSTLGFRTIASEYLKLVLYWGQYGEGKSYAVAALLIFFCLLWIRRRRSRSHLSEVEVDDHNRIPTV